jgi:rod shape determining protein RodA
MFYIRFFMASHPRKFIYLFHWPLLINILILMAMGLVNLYSASASAGGEVSPFFKSQLQWSLIGLVVMLFMLTFHYRLLLSLALPIYLSSLVLLVLVILMGKVSGGQKNWLILGPIRMQPSEFAKLAVILMLSRYYHKNSPRGRYGLKGLLLPMLIVGLPMGLILVEKDVGSALFFVLIGLTYFFITGLKYSFLVGGLILLLIGGAVGYRYFLSDYQRGRIQTFLNPEKDPRGKGYHLIQSKIAVGSGRILGKGYLQGHLNKFKFLPERHTDFVFPVLAEEWGFLGSMGMLLCFASLFLLMLQAAGKAKDHFGGFLIAGMTALLFWQMAINLGGVLGLLPLAGVTLPFFSYGGSALLTDLLGFGIVLNVYMRRYVF